ncbi:MAG: DNA repair exonuclease [Acidobacteriota bacterium]|jgi:DNA repair exonuclease SbcCD nuclease subunit|nr:DNA repair exonuclease [Acidobacteriota bacterium]
MKPVRFIHTADIHLETGFSGAGLPSRLGGRKREAVRAAFRDILDAARREKADFVLVAGDLFELGRVTPDTVEFLKQQFASLAPVRVFVAPGNHDPFIKGSPYKDDPWPGNVHVFGKEEFQSVELPEAGVRVTGFGYARPFFDGRLFQKLPALPDDLCNIVVAHASDMGRVPEGKSAQGPFEVGELAGKNIRYCALGHYHRQRRLQVPDAGVEAWYAGVPEGSGWDEEGPGGYLFCEVGDGGVRVQGRVCSRFDLHSVEIGCDGFSTREQVVEALLRHRGAELQPNHILRVRLTGTPEASLDLAFAELDERLAGECLYIRWEDRLLPALDFEAIAGEKTLRGEFARFLGECIADCDASGGGGGTAESPFRREVLERARRYGLDALSGREVRLR